MGVRKPTSAPSRRRRREEGPAWHRIAARLNVDSTPDEIGLDDVAESAAA